MPFLGDPLRRHGLLHITSLHITGDRQGPVRLWAMYKQKNKITSGSTEFYAEDRAGWWDRVNGCQSVSWTRWSEWQGLTAAGSECYLSAGRTRAHTCLPDQSLPFWKDHSTSLLPTIHSLQRWENAGSEMRRTHAQRPHLFSPLDPIVPSSWALCLEFSQNDLLTCLLLSVLRKLFRQISIN